MRNFNKGWETVFKVYNDAGNEHVLWKKKQDFSRK